MKKSAELPFPTTQRKTREELAAELDRRHPEVYELFERLTFEAIRAGAKRFGARLVLERCRWEFKVARRPVDGGPAINDWVAPVYARRFMARYPKHAGLFETRERKTA